MHRSDRMKPPGLRRCWAGAAGEANEAPTPWHSLADVGCRGDKGCKVRGAFGGRRNDLLGSICHASFPPDTRLQGNEGMMVFMGPREGMGEPEGHNRHITLPE